MGGPVLESTFVGRAEELLRASQALDALAAGTAVAVAVAGEPGIGKSRLLAEVGALAERRGQLVLTGRAAEFERDLPFGLFVDALDEHLRTLPPDKFQRLGAELQAELAQLFPSLADLAGDGRTLLHDERYRAHRAVRDLLERLAAARPLVLLLDDLHWADHASIELLSALLRRPPGAAVLIAVSLRPRQADALLASVVEHAVREGLLERIDLRALGDDDARRVLSSTVGSSLRDSICAEAGGNPFYLEELARALSSTAVTRSIDRPTDEAPGGGGLPPAVTAALEQELSVPGDHARLLLRGAAVAGDPFDPELAAAAAELSEDLSLSALDELVEHDLVRPTNVPRRFRFRHPLLRRAVYDATPSGWRIRAHQRTASALAARGAAAIAQAHHVEQSAPIGDLEAIALLSEAGYAAAQRAPGTAARWFSAALRLLPDMGVEPEERVGLLVALADSLIAVGRLEDGRAVIVELLELVPAEVTGLHVKLVGACAQVEHLLGRHRDAHDRLRSALAHVPQHGSPAAVELLIELAVNRFYEADYERMLDVGREALAAASALTDAPLVAAATAVAAAACSFAGDIPGGRVRAKEAAQLVDALTDAELATRLDSICYLAWAESFLEHHERCIEHTDRGIAVARACGRGELLPQLVQAQAQALALSGRLVEAVDVAERAVEAARLAANPHSLVWALMNLALALLDRDATSALSTARESVELTRDLEPSAIFAMAERVYSVVLGEIGEHARCVEQLMRAGGPELDLIPLGWRPFFLDALTRAFLACDRRDDAAQAARHAQVMADPLGMAAPTAWAQRARAAVLLGRRQPGDAAELALASASGVARVGARVEEGISRALAGRALLAAGDRDRAVAESQSAAALFEAGGATRLHEEVERELRRLGRPYRRRPQHTGGGAGALTARELEIAELVGARLTNREIAGELFLSEKTVEAHLRNIFGKLGVSSRRAIHDVLPAAPPPRDGLAGPAVRRWQS